MHPLLRTYERHLLQNELRLPMPQDPGRATARNLRVTLMDADSLRRVKSRGNGKCLSPLPTPQRFTRPPAGTNTPESMIAGLHKINARRLSTKTRGQSAGVI